MHDLLQLMYQDGYLSSTELAALKRTSRNLRENPVRILRSLNIATPGEIKDLLQKYYGFPAATDKVIEELDESLRAIIPADLALHYCVLPIAEDKNDLYVLMEDPTDKGTINQLQFFLNRKIVPVIATVVQLSNGLCRLYGVEPGRLKLSGLLETSRGAVGISSTLNLSQTHLIDDSQPLLDDEVFKRLKAKPKRKAPQDSGDGSPELVSALNILGLRLALAKNRAEALTMSNERLGQFAVSLKSSSPNSIILTWHDGSCELDLSKTKNISEAPYMFRTILKKIAQCRPE